jgi:protein SCO1/2
VKTWDRPYRAPQGFFLASLIFIVLDFGANLVSASSLSASSLSASSLSAPPAPQAAAGPYAQIGLEQKPGAQVDLTLPFRDESGAPITLAQVAAGHPVLLVPSYYRCPMLCSYVLTGLVQGLDGISLQPGRDYRVAAVSIDPREGAALAAAKKKTYLARIGRDRGAAEGWRFLTGPQTSIAALAAAVGFRYAFDSALGEYAHPAAVIALTPDGRVSRYFPGVEFPPNELRLGLVAASRGKLGSLSDRVYLACYRYNPVTGKYGPYVSGGLRVLGVGLVLALILAGASMERKSRKRARAQARSAEGAAARG